MPHTAPSPSPLRRLVRGLPLVAPVVDFLKRNDPVLTQTEVRGVSHHGTRVFNGWTWSPAIRSIALAPRVHRILRQLYGRKPLPFQTLNFPIGTEQKVHSDAIHFSSDPPTYMCGVWVALEDIDLTNGALVYYPGSHKLPVVTMEDVAPEPGPKHYPAYEAKIAAVVREKKLEPAYAVLRKGQALIWASNLLHGGSSHQDKGRTRHSQVTHYFFEGCQSYMPLESYGGYRHLRMADWARQNGRPPPGGRFRCRSATTSARRTIRCCRGRRSARSGSSPSPSS